MRRIVCFGDSNTHGTPPLKVRGPFDRYPPDVRWPRVMASALADCWELVEEGQPGRTAVLDDPVEGQHRNGSRILLALLDSHRPVDLLVIMLGTNDAKRRFNLTGTDIAFGIGRLVEIAMSSTFVDQCLIVCPPQVRETGALAEIFQGAEQRVANLAKPLADVAAQHGAHFFDAGTVVETDPIDGVHLSEESHQKLGRTIAEVVSGLKPGPG